MAEEQSGSFVALRAHVLRNSLRSVDRSRIDASSRNSREAIASVRSNCSTLRNDSARRNAKSYSGEPNFRNLAVKIARAIFKCHFENRVGDDEFLKCYIFHKKSILPSAVEMLLW
jgi:hypothetical protein